MDALFHCDISFIKFLSVDTYFLFNMFDNRINSPGSCKAKVKPIAGGSFIIGTYATRYSNAVIENVTRKESLPLATHFF